MTDRFDEVLGAGRGSGRDPDDDSPLATARRLVDYLNSDDISWEMTAPVNITGTLIPRYGLAVHRELSFVHEYDHDGFLFLLSVTADSPPFAALWLHDDARRDGTPYAQLWVVDHPPQ
jgi:hypothetical protein